MPRHAANRLFVATKCSQRRSGNRFSRRAIAASLLSHACTAIATFGRFCAPDFDHAIKAAGDKMLPKYKVFNF